MKQNAKLLEMIRQQATAKINLEKKRRAEEMTERMQVLADNLKGIGRVMVVGDPNQAIYGFRGADTTSIDRMKVLLNAEEETLPMTYRCGKNIVEEARRLVADYIAFEGNHDGEVIQSFPYRDMFVQLKPRNTAVLSRSNAPLVPGALRCIRCGIKARIEGKKDVAKELLNLVDALAGRKITDLGPMLEKLAAWEAKQIEILNTANGRDKERRIETVVDKAETIRALGFDANGNILQTVQQVKDNINVLFIDSDDIENKDFVTFSTVHKAKGLEWETVYGLWETLYPGKTKDKQEEANIEYVLITRAVNKLVKVFGYKEEQG